MFLIRVVLRGEAPVVVTVVVRTLSDSLDRSRTTGSIPSEPTVPVPLTEVVPSDTT